VTQPLLDKIKLAAIKSEMAVFECSGVRGRILGRTAHTLICIVNPPDIGRSGARFSAAGILYLYKDSFTPQWRYAMDTSCFLPLCVAIIARRRLGLPTPYTCTMYMQA